LQKSGLSPLLTRHMSDGVAAAVGKLGAFAGAYVFPYIQAAGNKTGGAHAGAQFPFYVSSGLCVLSALLSWFFLPEVGQDTIAREDARFRTFLEANGWDTRQLGLRKGDGPEVGTGEGVTTIRLEDEETRGRLV
jgi:hypothetical protein